MLSLTKTVRPELVEGRKRLLHSVHASTGSARTEGNQGLTLLELLLAATLVGLVGLSFASIYGSSVSYLSREMLSISVQGEGTFAIEHMRRHLMFADGVTSPAGPLFPTAPVTTVTFTWAPTLAVGAGGQTSSYQWDSSLQELKYQDVAGGPWETIARHVSAVSFVRQSVERMAVNLTIQQTTGPQARIVNMATVVIHRGIPPP